MKENRDGRPSRDRSVKLASAHDTWRADAPGKIGSANTEKAPNRVSFLLSAFDLWRKIGMDDHPVTGQLSSLLPTILGGPKRPEK